MLVNDLNISVTCDHRIFEMNNHKFTLDFNEKLNITIKV